MRRKVFSAAGVFLSAVLAAFVLSHCALAQSPLASEHTTEVGELLRQGHRLEVQRRWGEALTHYEDAVRQFPGDRSLHLRFQFARLHYDLERRYSDRSYLDALTQLPLDEALDLYADVLLKIQAHYVEDPNWKELVEQGANNVDVALSEAVFLERHLPDVDKRRVDEFRHELRRQLGPLLIQTRNDARDAVAMAAGLAARRLQLAEGAVVQEFTCGAANALDFYSAYLTPDQLTDIYAQIEGNFVGLGVELKAVDGALLIVRVITGSPAQRSGILAGDRILAVDGRSTRSLSTDQAASLLQGEVGSIAELTVQTPDLPPRQVRIRRDRVEIPSIDQPQMLDSSRGIGYLKLNCFQKTTPDDLDAALWSLHRQGMKSLVVDLRGNPGGLLVAAVEAADKFVQQGIIVSTRGRNAEEDFTYSAHPSGTWSVPLVVLIDQHSASAAEIFAGAIRDHRRGTIVGKRSFGKGSVQGIFPLSNSGAGLRLTTAKFYSPSGHAYSRIGVQPDLLVYQADRPVYDLDLAADALSGGEDPMLAAALQAARQLVAQR